MSVPMLQPAPVTTSPASQSALAQAMMGTPTAMPGTPPQLNFGQGNGMGQGISQGVNNAFALAKMFGQQPGQQGGQQGPNPNPYQFGQQQNPNPNGVQGAGPIANAPNPNDPGTLNPSGITGGALNPGDNGGQNGTSSGILAQLQALFSGLGNGGSPSQAAGAMNAAGAFE